MSATKYLHISSTYRDRNKFPIPSKFEVLFTHAGNRLDSKTAFDPIILSYPFYEFVGNNIATNGIFNGGNNINPVLDLSSINQDSYYVGYQITSLGETRTILSYDGKTQTVSLDKPFDVTTWAVGNAYTIQDGSYALTKETNGTFALGSTASIPILAGTASAIDDFYKGMTLTNTTIEESRTILSYNGTTKTVTISSPFSSLTAGVDNYTITGNLYTYSINIQPKSIDGTKTPSLYKEYYIGDILEDETIGQFRIITSYDSSTHTITIDSPFTGGWSLTDSYSIRKSRPTVQSTFIGVPNPGPNFNQVQLNPVGPVTTNYTGYYLYPRGDGNSIYLITSHNLTTNIVTIAPTPTVSFTSGSNYDILQFTKDNVVPLNYNGSMVSQNQLVSYEIELLSLILPNTPLKSGSITAFYPYVFVELSNISESSCIGKNSIYSNNPHASNALFIAPISDISNPNLSLFIKLDGVGMVQTIKFKPNDDLYFSVTLPNGELFTPVLDDNKSPLCPKPELEITAIFSIKRL